MAKMLVAGGNVLLLVEPEGLGKHTEDTRPASPSCTLVLRKPDGDDTAESDAYLI